MRSRPSLENLRRQTLPAPPPQLRFSWCPAVEKVLRQKLARAETHLNRQIDSSIWRGDPEKTLSDWRIDVVTTHNVNVDEERQVDTVSCPNHETEDVMEETVESYHVHRSALITGSRTSGYFTHQFQGGGRLFKESEERVSRIHLHPLAAKVFPQVLEYLYGRKGDKIFVDTRNAVALWFLGDYFEMEDLVLAADNFWVGDINQEHMSMYYQHALIFNHEAILDRVIWMATKNIMDPLYEEILDEMQSQHIIRVFDHVQATSNSPQKSRLISSLLVKHSSRFDLGTFQRFTDESRLPHIDPRVALDLMEQERLLQTKCTTGPKSDLSGDGTCNHTAPCLSQLQERCIATLVKNWQLLHTPDASTLAKIQANGQAMLTKLLVDIVHQTCEESRRLRSQIFWESFRKKAAMLEDTNTKLQEMEKLTKSIKKSLVKTKKSLKGPSSLSTNSDADKEKLKKAAETIDKAQADIRKLLSTIQSMS